MCRRQLLLYSDKDELTDSKMIDALIEERKKLGIEVLYNNFKDSDHVSHYWDYPEKYKSLVAKVVDIVAEKWFLYYFDWESVFPNVIMDIVWN